MLTIALLLAVAMIALLAVPVELRFQVQRDAAWQGDCEIVWLFGLLRGTVARDGNAKKSEALVAPETLTRSSSFSPRHALAAIRDRRARRHLLRSIGNFFRVFHFSNLILSLRIGLDDPADTGRLWGMLGPVAAVSGNLRSAALRIDPDFSGECLQLSGRGTMKIIPLELIWQALCFLLSPDTLRLLRLLRGRTRA